MSDKKELKKIDVQWEKIETIGIFSTAHLLIKDGEEEIGYYRIWHSPETDNIAYYSSKEKHGVMPPMEYKAKENATYMIKKIKEDLEKMGMYFDVEEDKITDDVLIGKREFPKV